MKYERLGASNLQVSRLCLGTMMFADQTGPKEAAEIIADARDRGVNFVDTADVYSNGDAERLLGELLKGHRQEWIVATKLGNPMSKRVNEGHYSAVWVARAIEGSLRRLGVDHIDVAYLHRDYLGLVLEEPLRAMDLAIRQGKVRYWGLSNFLGWRIADSVRLARELGMVAPIVCQPSYNILNRTPEVEILPACAHYGIGVTAYSPLARGVLTGKYAPGKAPPPGARAERGDPRILQTEMRRESLEIAQTLKQHAEARGMSLAQFSTAWVLAHRAVTSVLAGPRTLDQWRHYVPALECQMTADDELTVDRLVAPGHPSTPGFNDPAYPLNARNTVGMPRALS